MLPLPPEVNAIARPHARRLTRHVMHKNEWKLNDLIKKKRKERLEGTLTFVKRRQQQQHMQKKDNIKSFIFNTHAVQTVKSVLYADIKPENAALFYLYNGPRFLYSIPRYKTRSPPRSAQRTAAV